MPELRIYMKVKLLACYRRAGTAKSRCAVSRGMGDSTHCY